MAVTSAARSCSPSRRRPPQLCMAHSVAGTEPALALSGVKEQMLPFLKEAIDSVSAPVGPGSCHFIAAGAVGTAKLGTGLLEACSIFHPK